MSLTNPNSVVTEERLSDFYQGILPYLGGMPDILANKFDKANMYSTDEKIVGQWTDGKPLYQKTIFTTTPSTKSTWLSVASLSNIDVCFIISAQSSRSDGIWIMLPHPGSDLCLRYESNNIKVFCTEDTDLNKDLRLTIQYTKTTDSPVAIGIDTDYSTTEKIVGTWIDGKPVYQKTIQTNTEFAYNNWTAFANIPNIESVINAIIHVQESDNSYSRGIRTNYYVEADVSSGDVGVFNNTGYTPLVSHITIQYTKTTD